MIDPGDRLRQTFEVHEHLAPDAARVYARVTELSRAYQRRRRGAWAAGGAMLGAGLIAGAITVPALLAAGPEGAADVVAAAGPSPESSMPTAETELQRQRDAYFAAGYHYGDAVKLAKIWNSAQEVGAIKAEAGRRLLAGETLPVAPSSMAPEPAAVDPRNAALVEAFLAAGYDYDDAMKLAKMWNSSGPYQAKVEAGQKLLNGDPLPVEP